MVRRLILLAIGLSALLWTAAARTPTSEPERVTIAGAGQPLLTDASQAPGESDRHWYPRQHTIAAVTESFWKSAPAHAVLAGMHRVRTFDTTRATSSPDPPARPAPLHLRHTPLLI